MEIAMPPLELRSPCMVGKRGKDSIGGTTNSGEVPFKEAMLSSEGRPSRRGAAGAVDRLKAEKSAAELQRTIESKVVTLDGHCWWCLCPCLSAEGGPHGIHDPVGCPSREKPEMADWDEPTSRIVMRLSKAKSAEIRRKGQKADGRGRGVQSMLSDEERRDRNRRRVAEQTARHRALEQAAKDRLRAWLRCEH